MTRILVIAAHPDDEVLGMGGTIAMHAAVRQDAVRIVCVTDGSSTQYPGDAEKRAQKEEEARVAAAELGVTDYVHLDLPDMRLDTLPHVDVNRVVEDQISDFEPTVVYTVHPDVNRDHRALFDSVAVATRPVPGQSVRRVLTYAPTSSTEWTPSALELVRPELVRRRDGHARPQARVVRALPNRGARLPASTERARDQGRGGVLRGELRLRGGRAVRARALARRLSGPSARGDDHEPVPLVEHQTGAELSDQLCSCEGMPVHVVVRAVVEDELARLLGGSVRVTQILDDNELACDATGFSDELRASVGTTGGGRKGW